MGPHLGTILVSNGSPTRPHGLILGEDKATPCTDLLEAFLQFFRIILHPFSLKIMDFGFLPGWGAKNHVQKQKTLTVQWSDMLFIFLVFFVSRNSFG